MDEYAEMQAGGSDDMSSVLSDDTAPMHPTAAAPKRQPDETERKLASKIASRIKSDKAFFKKSFERMRKDMKTARIGADQAWKDSGKYTANITGRHINQKVAALYAKNPRAVARRKEKLDFQIWDESEQSLMMAMQTVQMGLEMGSDPFTGQPIAMQDPGFQQAYAVVEDYKAGTQARHMASQIGRTLEILFQYFTTEQSPVDFKTSMKQVVRRASACGVAYVRLGFQREYEQDPQITQRLADFQEQLRYLEHLAEEVSEPNDSEGDREVKQREMELALKSLQAQQYVLIREGLTFDFPMATAVIPDQITRSLVGFVGARWLTVEHLYTREEAERYFKVDLNKDCKVYSDDGTSRDGRQIEMALDGEEVERTELICVWEHFDRAAGLVYTVCDGHPGFLREPGPPDVYLETFWPVEALTFNDIEDPSALFPPSDVALIEDMQFEYNRARQGQREHRQAARPRFLSRNGALDDESKTRMQNMEPFDVIEVNPLDGTTDLAGLVQAMQIPGVDPNLYETGHLFTDIQLVAGAQEAQFGAVAKATATESSIAEGSRIAAIDSNIDDLDAFLTRVARGSGQVLLREMSAEQVKEIVGPGAVWPQMTLDQIAKEMVLEVQAGSSGKPNQSQEIRNWKEMLPFLIQMPNIAPTWLARESLRRLDDKMDLTEALTENVPAIVAMNRSAGAAPAPGAAPEDQGNAGADNASIPGGPAGTEAGMGNNQQPV